MTWNTHSVTLIFNLLLINQVICDNGARGESNYTKQIELQLQIYKKIKPQLQLPLNFQFNYASEISITMTCMDIEFWHLILGFCFISWSSNQWLKY